jgi:uncharacterized protein
VAPVYRKNLMKPGQYASDLQVGSTQEASMRRWALHPHAGNGRRTPYLLKSRSPHMSNIAATQVGRPAAPRNTLRIEIIKKLYADFRRGDVEGILAACTEDSCWSIPGSGALPFAGTHVGRAAIGEFYCSLVRHVDIDHLQVECFLQDENMVVAMGRMSGTARRTGKSFASTWLHCWTFDNTRIASFQDSYDTLAVAQALQ